MTVIINGTAGVTYPDSTTQASANISAANITSGTLASGRLPAGSVLQVVNATFGTQTLTTSATFVDTGLTVSITPTSATSKILIDANVTGLSKASTGQVALRLVRNSTALINFESGAAYTASGGVGVGGSSCNYLDSPATTSATTYKVQFLTPSGGSAYICNDNGTQTATCTITAMEISA
jgi:hypothetical protein